MAASQLLNVPTDDRAWNLWSFPHRVSHAQIATASFQKLGVFLADYELDPFLLSNPDDQSQLLWRHAKAHLEMTAAVGQQSADLQDIDLSDKRALIGWISGHWQEHQNVESALGV